MAVAELVGPAGVVYPADQLHAGGELGQISQDVLLHDPVQQLDDLVDLVPAVDQELPLVLQNLRQRPVFHQQDALDVLQGEARELQHGDLLHFEERRIVVEPVAALGVARRMQDALLIVEADRAGGHSRQLCQHPCGVLFHFDSLLFLIHFLV